MTFLERKFVRNWALVKQQIECTLYEWFTKMTRLNVPVSGPMLIGKAKKRVSNKVQLPIVLKRFGALNL